MSNGNEAAFPRSEMSVLNEGFIRHNGRPGLTKREYFAGLAMQGYCAAGEGTWATHESRLAELSVKCADALIKELDSSEGKEP